jgi:hypothetical protein
MTQVRFHWWWRPGWEPGRRFYTFHFTFAGQPGVQEMAAQARERLAGMDGLDLVPGQWLHLTTQGIGFADEVSDADLTAITSAAGPRLAAVQPAALTIGPPQAASEGVACLVRPDGALSPARDALRAAIADVWGQARVPDPPEWTPHVSIAYASAGGPGDAFDAALSGVTAATATVRAVDLIRLGRDQRVYEWETITSLPLSSTTTSS